MFSLLGSNYCAYKLNGHCTILYFTVYRGLSKLPWKLTDYYFLILSVYSLCKDVLTFGDNFPDLKLPNPPHTHNESSSHLFLDLLSNTGLP